MNNYTLSLEPVPYRYLSWPPYRCLICNSTLDSESGSPWSTIYGSYAHAFFLCTECNKEFDRLYPIPEEDFSLEWKDIPRLNHKYGDPVPEIIEFLKGKGKLAEWLVP